VRTPLCCLRCAKTYRWCSAARSRTAKTRSSTRQNSNAWHDLVLRSNSDAANSATYSAQAFLMRDYLD